MITDFEKTVISAIQKIYFQSAASKDVAFVIWHKKPSGKFNQVNWHLHWHFYNQMKN